MNTSSSPSQESNDYLYYIYNFRAHRVLNQKNIGIFDMSFVEKSINEFKSSFNELNIHIYKLNTFSNYEQSLKNVETNKKPDYYTLIKSLFQNIKNTVPSESNLLSKLSNSDDLKITINFKNLNIIINHIIIWLSYVFGVFTGVNKAKFNSFFEQTSPLKEENKEHIEEELTWSNLAPKCKEINKFLAFLEHTRTLEIKLNQGTESLNDVSINMERMLLFYLFFDKIFPDFITVKWDLNIPKLNQQYTNMPGIKSLYNNKPNYIEEVSSSFHKFFLCNWLLNKKIYLRKNLQLTLLQYDDYIIEISNLLHNEINLKDHVSKDIINQKYNSNFLMTSNILELTIEFNSLDDILFRNLLFLLYQNLISDKSVLLKIKINLFPKEAFSSVNQRKILKNFLFNPNPDNRFYEIELEHKYHEKTLNFNFNTEYNWNNENKNVYISGDKIFDILSTPFQANLMHLIYLLDKNTSINYICFQANLPSVLKNNQNYTMSLIYFFHNFFKMLSQRKDTLHLGTVELETNITIPLYFINQVKPVKLDGVKIQSFKMKIGNSSGLIDYCHFPFYYVDYLHLSKVNFNDLKNIINGIKNSVYDIKSLRQVKLELDYVYNIEMNVIKELCKECLVDSLRVFWITIYNEFSHIQSDEFITTIVKSINYCEKTRVNFEAEFSIYIDINDIEKYNSYYYRQLINEHLKITSEWNPEIYFYLDNFACARSENMLLIRVKILKWETNDEIRDVVNRLASEVNLTESNNIMLNTGSILKMLFKPTSSVQLKFNLKATED